MLLEAGLLGTVRATVTTADTADSLGSGDVPVLGTPRVVALLEAATVEAVRGWLDHGQTTVGLHVDVEHLLAAPVGAVVTTEARLVEVDGRRLVFVVRLEDDAGRLLASGRVRRAVVDREQFLRAVPPAHSSSR